MNVYLLKEPGEVIPITDSLRGEAFDLPME